MIKYGQFDENTFSCRMLQPKDRRGPPRNLGSPILHNGTARFEDRQSIIPAAGPSWKLWGICAYGNMGKRLKGNVLEVVGQAYPRWLFPVPTVKRNNRSIWAVADIGLHKNFKSRERYGGIEG